MGTFLMSYQGDIIKEFQHFVIPTEVRSASDGKWRNLLFAWATN
jgi:hypothetical protein